MIAHLSAALATLIAYQADAKPKSFKGGVNYPLEARRLGEQGTVVIDLTIDTKGKVTVCGVMRSSGSKSLDYASCKAAITQIRYQPATDSSGAPTRGKGRVLINWRLGCRTPVTEPDPDAILVCGDPGR